MHDGWFEKNKETINQTVVMLLKNSKGNKLVSLLFHDVGIEECKINLKHKWFKFISNELTNLIFLYEFFS